MKALKVYITRTPEDERYAAIVADQVRKAGHCVWSDVIIEGDGSVLDQISATIKEADVFIVIVSRNALRSQWVMQEYSVFALSEISDKAQRIIPVLVDDCQIPHPLQSYRYFDLRHNPIEGIVKVIEAAAQASAGKSYDYGQEPAVKGQGIVPKLSDALKEGRLTLVCGAGVSMGIGMPSWDELLLRLLKIAADKLSRDGAVADREDALQYLKEQETSSAIMVGKFLKTILHDGFLAELREALYESCHMGESSDLLEAISELAQSKDGKKILESIITFNFDGLLEEYFDRKGIPHKTIYSDQIRRGSSKLPIYHVHGFLPRRGELGPLNDVVFSEDTYHSQFIEPYSWSNLIQLSTFAQNTCLFIGLSLSDPNLRRLLDISHRKSVESSVNHYIIMKRISAAAYSKSARDMAMLMEDLDATAFGISIIWIDDFEEIPGILRDIVRGQSPGS